MRFSKSLIILALSAGLAACGDSDKSSDNPSPGSLFTDILALVGTVVRFVENS